MIEKTITLTNKNEPLTIIPLGDIHIGAANCDKKYLQETINWIKNKENAYVIGMGDYVDCIIPTDPRFDIKEVDRVFIDDLANMPMRQVEYLRKMFDPIKDRIVTLLPGNHEEKFRQHHYVDVMSELCRSLGASMGGYMTFIRLKWDRDQFRIPPVVIWAHHGWFGSSGRKKGSKVNNLEDIATGYSADLYLAGHSHDLFGTSIEQISLAQTGDKLYSKKKIFCNTGTFMRTITTNSDSYGERKAFTPKKIGVIRVDIYPKSQGVADIHIRE